MVHTGTEPPRDDGDGRLSSPSAERNLAPILDVLRDWAPRSGRALEVASGTGRHCAAFAAAFPDIVWRPTDAEPSRLRSIQAWIDHAGVRNVEAPALLDAGGPWPFGAAQFDLVVSVNLLHIVSDETASAVVVNAAHALVPAGRLMVYGPFLRDGAFASAGDRAFHAELKRMDPAIGYKDVATLARWLDDAGFRLLERREMPSNNLTFVAETA